MAVGIMDVVLVNAKKLNDSDFFGDMDPYVILEYKGQTRKSKVLAGQGKNPEWKEKFTFKVEYPGSGDDYKLLLKIMDKDIFSQDDFIGQTTIYVKDVLAIGAQTGIAELYPRKYRVVDADQTYRGEIEVGLTFISLAEEEKNDEDLGGWKQSQF